jgi:hypothetical protein
VASLVQVANEHVKKHRWRLESVRFVENTFESPEKQSRGAAKEDPSQCLGTQKKFPDKVREETRVDGGAQIEGHG